MFCLLLGLFIVFNGRFTLEILIFGVVISLVVCLFAAKFLEYSFKKEFLLVRILPSLFLYILYLLKEIVKANFCVMRFLFRSNSKLKPCIVSFKTDIESPFFNTLLANSITLTPGTITVSNKDGEFKVHCLDESLAEDIEKSGFVVKIQKMMKKTGGKL